MSSKDKPKRPSPKKDAPLSPEIRQLDEKGALSMFTPEEIEEFRYELAKRAKMLKQKWAEDSVAE